VTQEQPGTELTQRAPFDVTHGAYSERRIRPYARTLRRRIARQLGLRLRELDPIARGYFEQYVRCIAKVQAIDEHIAEHGLLDGEGRPAPAMALYTTLINSSRLSLARLEDHLRERRSEHGSDLRAYLAEQYGQAEDAEVVEQPEQ
jgi:hypothetical protein